jgi:retron-type reverse transcriptase
MRSEDLVPIPQENLKDLEQLATLKKLNAKRDWRNTDLYRFLYKKGLYILAFQKLKSASGKRLLKSGQIPMDDLSFSEIEKTIKQMREESYQPKPVRTTHSSRKGESIQSLGVLPLKDKIVQEVMRMVMEAVFDSPEGPFFEEASHGFRKNRNPHTALREIRHKWSGVNWFIETDTRNCFTGIDHEKLIEVIEEKIPDQRFLNLLRKFLKSGQIEQEWQQRNSFVDTPQGGILSPILANIFFDKFDKFVKELQEEYKKGEAKKANRVYRALATKKQQLLKQGLTKTKEFREIVRQMRDMPSLDPKDENFIRIKYIRYADEWLIGIIGSHRVAEEIKERISSFLKDKLKLDLSTDSMKVIHAKTEQATFLDTSLSIGSSKSLAQKVTLSANGSGHHVKRRSTGWQVVLRCPIRKLIHKLAEKGYCDKEGRPKAKGAFVQLDPEQIILHYSSVNKGIQHYYRPCDNFVELRRIQYILKFSLAKTLAEKYRKSVPQVFTQQEIRTKYITATGEQKVVKFFINRNWQTNRDGFITTPGVDQVTLGMRLRTRSKLGKVCIVCGAEEDIEMHHIRHLRKSGKRQQKDPSFPSVMGSLDRKQVPLCEECHRKVHRGEYDGIKLTDLK